MAYAKDGIRSTYLTKTNWDAGGAELRERLDELNDLYNKLAFYDGTEYRLNLNSAAYQTILDNAMAKFEADLAALKYKGEA